MATVDPEAVREGVPKQATTPSPFQAAADDDCGVCSGAKSMLRAAFGRYGSTASQAKAAAVPDASKGRNQR